MASSLASTSLGKLGPCMLAINEQQREFVFALMRQGLTLDYTAAARVAGYCEDNPENANRAAYRLAHDEKVLAAIHEEAYKRLRAGTLAAVSLLQDFIADPAVEEAVRLKAATALMDRAGLHAKSEHLVAVSHSDDRQSKLLRLAELTRAAGGDIRAVLGSLADALEGDCEVIEAGAAAPEPKQVVEPKVITDATPAPAELVDASPRGTLPRAPLVTDIVDVEPEPAPAAVQWR